MKNKTLYVSDLDGTLLRSNQTTSEYTNEVINSLTEKGIVFFLCDSKVYLHIIQSDQRIRCQNTGNYI